MTDLFHSPLCEKCDQPMIMLELVKPRARRHSVDDMLPKPPYNEKMMGQLNKGTKMVVSLVGHRNDVKRFEHQEWLLAGDGDVSSHDYYLVRDCIYSFARVEF